MGITVAQFNMICARRFRDGGNVPLPANAALQLRLNLTPVAGSSPRASKSGVKFTVTVDMQPFPSPSDPFGYTYYFSQQLFMANNGTPKHMKLEDVMNLIQRSGVPWPNVELRMDRVQQYAERYSVARQASVIERFEANEVKIVEERAQLYAWMVDVGITSPRAQRAAARLAQIDALIAMGAEVRNWTV
jgi:hypothetical protein